MLANRLIQISLVVIFLLAGCVSSQHYIVDSYFANESLIFNSQQSPTFSMKLSQVFKYLGCTDLSKNNTGHSYSKFNHYFASNKDTYFVKISMITLKLGYWNDYSPWKTELEKEVHGEKTFNCGTCINKSLDLNDGEKGMLGRYGFSTGISTTTKVWVYTPNKSINNTRIVVYYTEKGDKTNDMQAFLSRADSRTDFKME